MSDKELFYSDIHLNVGDSEMMQEVHLIRGVRVTGSISFEKEDGTISKLPKAWCKLYSDSVHLETTGASSKIENFRTSITPGCFGAEFSPNVYHLAIEDLPPDAYLVSAKANGRDILESGVSLSADTQIDIVVNEQGSVVHGVVTDSKGERISNAVVALVPDAPLRSAGPLYRSNVTDFDGSYELRGVAPGSYHVYAWTDLEGAAYRNAEFMKAYDGLGISLEAKKGEDFSVNVTAF